MVRRDFDWSRTAAERQRGTGAPGDQGGHRIMTHEQQRARGAAVRHRMPEEAHRHAAHAADAPDRYARMRHERERDWVGAARSAAENGVERGRRAVGGRLGQRGGRPASRRPYAPLTPRKVLHRVGAVLAVLLVAIVVFGVSVTGRLNDGITSDTRAALTPALPGQPFYMLLVGTDKSADRVAENSTGGVYRTDSIILARVDPIGAKVTLVSIQRDTLVDLGGSHGKQKINAAYTLGGAPLLIKEVSELAGVPIAHYAELDFDSFVNVVDAIGGIDVNIPIDLQDTDAHLDVKAGQQTIDGATALALCRARHAYDKYGSGDYYRTANQRMVLGAILKKGLSGNPLTLMATVNAAADSVSTDLSGVDLMFLGIRFVGFDASKDLMSGLEPTTGKQIGGTWYEIVQEDAWKTMMDRVDKGLSPYESDADNPTAGLAG